MVCTSDSDDPYYEPPLIFALFRQQEVTTAQDQITTAMKRNMVSKLSFVLKSQRLLQGTDYRNGKKKCRKRGGCLRKNRNNKKKNGNKKKNRNNKKKNGNRKKKNGNKKNRNKRNRNKKKGNNKKKCKKGSKCGKKNNNNKRKKWKNGNCGPKKRNKFIKFKPEHHFNRSIYNDLSKKCSFCMNAPASISNLFSFPDTRCFDECFKEPSSKKDCTKCYESIRNRNYEDELREEGKPQKVYEIATNVVYDDAVSPCDCSFKVKTHPLSRGRITYEKVYKNECFECFKLFCLYKHENAFSQCVHKEKYIWNVCMKNPDKKFACEYDNGKKTKRCIPMDGMKCCQE